MCKRVLIFAPCRALGIRHYYLRELMGNSVNIDRLRGSEKEKDEAEIWIWRGLGVDNLMVSLVEKIGLRRGRERDRGWGRGGIWTLAVAMAAFGFKMSVAPNNLYCKHCRELPRCQLHCYPTAMQNYTIQVERWWKRKNNQLCLILN